MFISYYFIFLKFSDLFSRVIQMSASLIHIEKLFFLGLGNAKNQRGKKMAGAQFQLQNLIGLCWEVYEGLQIRDVYHSLYHMEFLKIYIIFLFWPSPWKINLTSIILNLLFPKTFPSKFDSSWLSRIAGEDSLKL